MRNYIALGKLIKEQRGRKNESLSDVANAIKKDRTYIFKLESGQGRPSIEVLNALIGHFAVSDITLIKQLFEYAGYPNPVVA
jgi:transcriptional regulator with XRE-family HTH domain